MDWSFGSCAQGVALQPYYARAASVGSLFGGRFEIEGTIGKGGMGVVLRAQDLAVGRSVAIKLLLDPVDERKRARFAREGQVAARLRHPGIVKVHGGGVTDDGYPFWVLELVEGARTLTEALRERDRAAGLALLLETAQAVAAAHREGIVHRDLKPDNVLVDAQGRPRVCDFGLAWHLDADRLTRTEQLLGTPLYMAPEGFQPDHRDPDPTVDVWALGVMLYEHLTARRPYEAGTLFELMAQVGASDPPPVRSLAPDVSPALAAVCEQALARDPSRRFPDAGAFADALDLAVFARGRGRPAPLVVVGVLALAGLAVAVTPQRAPEPAAPPSAAPASPSAASAPPAPLAATRILESTLTLAHEPVGLRQEVLDGFARAAARCSDPDLAKRIELERIAYLFRRGRNLEVVRATGALERDPVYGDRAAILHGLAAYDVRLTHPELRAAAPARLRPRWRRSERPLGPEHLSLGALLAYLDKDYPTAITRSRAALALDPDQVTALLVEGMSQGIKLNLMRSAEVLRRARRLAPDDSMVCWALMMTLTRLERPLEVLELSRRSLRMLGPRPQLLQLTDHWVRLNNLRRYEEARRFLEGVLVHEPNHPGLTFRLGVTLLSARKRPLWAGHLLRDAYRRDPAEIERLLADFNPGMQARYRRLLGQPTPPPAEALHVLGEEAMLAGDYADGVALLRRAITQGSVGAQMSLGLAYERGRGVPRDDAEAYRRIRASAQAGYPRAMHNMGVRLQNGLGVVPDLAAARRWYRKAAQAGVPDSMVNLGTTWIQGTQAEQRRAADWFEKGAAAGHARGMFFFGRCLLRGLGRPRDPAAGLAWYRKALAAADPTLRREIEPELREAQERHPDLR